MSNAWYYYIIFFQKSFETNLWRKNIANAGVKETLSYQRDFATLYETDSIFFSSLWFEVPFGFQRYTDDGRTMMIITYNLIILRNYFATAFVTELYWDCCLCVTIIFEQSRIVRGYANCFRYQLWHDKRRHILKYVHMNFVSYIFSLFKTKCRPHHITEVWIFSESKMQKLRRQN